MDTLALYHLQTNILLSEGPTEAYWRAYGLWAYFAETMHRINLYDEHSVYD